MNAFLKELFEKCEEFIDNSSPEDLIDYEKSLEINYGDYSDGISFSEFIDLSPENVIDCKEKYSCECVKSNGFKFTYNDSLVMAA